MEDLGTRAPEGQALPGAQPPVSPVPAAPAPAPRRRGRGLGVTSVLCALVMVIVTTSGSLLAGTAVGALALPLAIIALALSGAAIVVGVLAIVRGEGRTRAGGIAGLVLGVLLNPALLALLLPGHVA